MKKFFLLPVLFILMGCVPRAVTAPATEYEHAASLVKDKDYGTAVEMYRKIAAESPQSLESGNALYQAAYLEVFSDNPHKDYGKALQDFDEFLQQFPDHPRAVDARNWQAVLKMLLENRKENEQLKQSIEELKKLDIRHEQRRRR